MFGHAQKVEINLSSERMYAEFRQQASCVATGRASEPCQHGLGQIVTTVDADVHFSCHRFGCSLLSSSKNL